MKRIIYTALALAAVAVGCTKSNLVDVPEAQKTPITFDTYNGRVPVTKASDLTSDNIAGIHVTGFLAGEGALPTEYTKEYMDVDVTKADGKWTYSPLAYWPASGTIKFVAYGSNAKNHMTFTQKGDKTSFTEFTYVVPNEVANQQDLVVSGIGTETKEGNTVKFTMKHLLSRVGFQIKTIGTGATVTISSVKLCGTFKTTGTVDLTAQDTEGNTGNPKIVAGTTNTVSEYSLFKSGESFVTSNAATATRIYGNTSSAEDFTADSDNCYMMIMPGQVGLLTGDANPYIEVKYQLTGQTSVQTANIPLGETEGTVFTPMTFEAGKAYEFIFTVSISSIEFTGEVMTWDVTHENYTNPL